MTAKRANLDWPDIRRRLQASDQALDRAMRPDRQRVESVYDLRARELAQRREHQPEAPRRLYLVCHLLHERYAIDVRQIEEIVPLRGCSPIPGAAAILLGVAAARGEVWSVISLRAILGLERESATIGGLLLLLRNSDGVGVRVDAADDLTWIADQDFSALAGTRRPELAAHCRGVTADGLIQLNMGDLPLTNDGDVPD